MATKLQKAETSNIIYKHIFRVQHYMNFFIKEMLNRALKHDQSKLSEEELPLFAEVTKDLKESEYGNDDYEANKRKLGLALEHHYRMNSHHPEHYPNGINDMDLLDIIEMFCDWSAAVEQHEKGNFYNSLKLNKDRFKIDQQLIQIFENTYKKYFPTKE